MGRNHLFDAMRGVAAIMVVGYHQFYFGLTWLPNGYMAVDFFFVLSGYVIAQAYERRLAGEMTVARFMEIRLIRLYPLVAIGTVLGMVRAVASSSAHGYTASQIATAFCFNIFVLPSPTAAHDLFPLDGPVWSLFFELIINIAFALITYRLPRLALAGLIAIGAAGFAYFAIRANSSQIGWDQASFVGGFFRVTYSFTWGQLLYRLRGPEARRRMTWLALAALAGLVLMLGVATDDTRRLEWCLFATLVISPALVALGSVIELPRIGHRVAAILGDLSYPLYAVHMPLMILLGFGLKKLHVSLLLYPAILLPLLLVASFAVTRFYDDPVRKRLSAWLAVRQSARTQIG